MERFLKFPLIRSLHSWSYSLKITLGILFLASALGIALTFLFMNQQKLFSLKEEQKNDNLLEKNLRKLSEHILRHHILLKQYRSGDKTIKGDLLQLQMSVVTDLQTLQQRLETKEIENEYYHENVFLKQLSDAWQILIKNEFESKKSSPEALYSTLLQRLNIWLVLIGGRSSIIEREPAFIKFFQNISWINFPFEILLLNSALAVPSENKDALEAAINMNSAMMQQGVKVYREYPSGIDIDLISLQESARTYKAAGDDLISYIRTEKSEAWNEKEFLLKAESLAASQYTLWDSLELINQQVMQKLFERISFYQALAIAGILLSVFLGSFFLILVAIESYVPIQNMFRGIDRFSKGEMNSRATIYFDDEVGRIARVINQLGDDFEQIVGQLHRTGIQLSTSTTEIAAAAKQQEITVVEQEATTKEIAVTAGEISVTAKEFAKTVNSISETAEQTSGLATTGKEGLNQMELIMRQMVEASASIASRLGVLNEKAGSITSVVTTIAKVADQTNLLSLNASIEAEKAGEMGRSFAVIAREIRRLADQTASATVDIEKMVNEMVSAVSAAVMGVDKFTEEIRTGVSQVSRIGEVLSQIIEQVQGLTISFENVNQGMRNQTLGAEQINEAINQLSEVAQQTSTSIRQFHNAIEQLNIAAREMQISAAKIRHTA